MDTQERAIAIALQAGVPVISWGEPGIGKTKTYEAICRSVGYKCITVIASIRDPSDFGGLPYMDNGAFRLVAAEWGHRANAFAEEGYPTVVFFDEISTAPPAVQSAMLRPILENQLGELTLNPLVRWAAAANPPECAAGGFDLTAPLANRFCHLQFKLNSQRWMERALLDFPDEPAPKLPEDWENGLHEARAMVVSFLRTRPSKVQDVPKVISTDTAAYPTARSWMMAARLLAASKAVAPDDKELFVTLLAGCVGTAITLEMFTWLKELDLPDPEELLAKPAKAKFNNARQDRSYAILSAVVAAVLAKNTYERYRSAIEVFVMASRQKVPIDILTIHARNLEQNRPLGNNLLGSDEKTGYEDAIGDEYLMTVEKFLDVIT